MCNALIAHLANASDKLGEEQNVLRRQQQRTRADISRLVEVLKSSGASGLISIQSELTRLESEDGQLERTSKELDKRQSPLIQIYEAARKFIEKWAEVNSLLDEATEEEKTQIIRQHIEVIELRFYFLTAKRDAEFSNAFFQNVLQRRSDESIWQDVRPIQMKIG